ncbi:unnamed protein product [Durusdinium trenchii]|uniref:Uncharacterized protein n=2 Tax=Durusdinium trenchii TaxID=1381693 RepID=A0ABP0LTF7_9DINO
MTQDWSQGFMGELQLNSRNSSAEKLPVHLELPAPERRRSRRESSDDRVLLPEVQEQLGRGRWKSKSKMSMKMCAMISPKRCVKNAFEEFEDCVDLVLLNLESGRGDPSVQRDGLLWRPAVPAP